MIGIDEIAADAIASGKLTDAEVALILTYRDYLRELPLRRTNRDTWRRKWAAYAGGLADGPTTPEEFERIRAERRGQP